MTPALCPLFRLCPRPPFAGRTLPFWPGEAPAGRDADTDADTGTDTGTGTAQAGACRPVCGPQLILGLKGRLFEGPCAGRQSPLFARVPCPARGTHPVKAL